MKKNIKLLFITILTLLLGSHALLPHHHHYDTSFSSNCSLPIGKERRSDKSDTPNYHCHAFNNIVNNDDQDKLTKLIKHQPLFVQRLEQIIEPPIDYTIFFSETPDFEIFNQGYGFSYSLRAPPALS